MILQNTPKSGSSDDFMRIQDILTLCLAQWRWFVLSVLVCLAIAVYYVLSTPPVYTRTASILIKEDSKGQSLSGDVGSSFAQLGLVQSNTNVNNEMVSIQSPSVMYDVVRRLHLDVEYHTDGTLYRRVLYGADCPVQLSFLELGEQETASLTLRLTRDSGIRLTDFERNGQSLAADSSVTGQFNDTLQTPLGQLLVIPSATFSGMFESPVYVTRTPIPATAARCAADFSVALNNEKTTILNLTFRDVSTQRAEDVLNTLIAVYNENWVKDKNQIAVSTSLFINERLAVIESELGHVDDNISSFKSEHLLPDVQAASQLYMSESSQTKSQILTLNTQLSMARYIRNYLTGSAGRNQLLPANSGLESANIEKLIAEYNTAQLERNNLVANSSEQNPLVVDMDQSLSAMRGVIVRSVDNLITTLNTQLSSLQKSEQATTERLAANPSQAKYLLSVERQQKVKEALYLFLLQKREENELSQAFTAYNTRVITPPTGNMVPTAPQKKNILFIAFMVGLLLPGGILFSKEALNTKVRGKKDLDALSIPLAGEIPQTGKKTKKHTALAVYVKSGKRDVINEAFRVLRTNIDFMLHKNPHEHVLLVTSFNPGSGKSFLTLNLACSLALKGKRVLIIDGDLRKASLSAFVHSPGTGLANYLAGEASDAQALIQSVPDFPTLSVLPVGTLPPNPTELLEDDRFPSLIARLRSEYDYVLIDCSPVEIVADTQILAREADRTLFVVRAGLLERSMLADLETMYTDKRFKNMALILNGTANGSGRYGYKYGYHYGYGDSNYYASTR